MPPPTPRVLVCGHRAGIARALQSLGVAFTIWHDRPVKYPGAAEAVFVHRFPRSREAVSAALDKFPEAARSTHVIAGTEAAVVAASLARRRLSARSAPHAIAQRCHDKLYMKHAVMDLGIPMTEFIDGNDALRNPKLLDRLGSPVVVKERTQSGGRGLEIVENPPDEPVQLRGRLVERFVDAPEISVETFVHRGRIAFQNVTEYVRKRHINALPAELSEWVTHQAIDRTRRVVEGLRIQWGVTHTEWYLRREGLLFGEIALRPPGGYIMELISAAYDFDSWAASVAVELDREFPFPPRAEKHAAALILYPGPGRVRRVTGLAKVRRMPEVFDAKIKVRAHDILERRSGAGHDVGRVLVCTEERRRSMVILEAIESSLKIEMEPVTE